MTLPGSIAGEANSEVPFRAMTGDHPPLCERADTVEAVIVEPALAQHRLPVKRLAISTPPRIGVQFRPLQCAY